MSETTARCPWFDHHSPDLSADPYPTFARLRKECPVGWSDAWGGFWVVSGHAEVEQVAHDDATFCSGEGVSFPTVGQARPLIPIEVDPPLFHKYRRILNPRFSPGAVERFEPDIRRMATTLIDGFIERGECDLMAELAGPLPAMTTLRMLGLPEEEWEFFLHCIHVGVHESAHDLDKSVEAILEVYTAIAAALEERERAGFTGDDLISYLARAESEGERLSEEEILDICLLLLFGGLDTTAAAISHAALYLDQDLEARERLRRERQLIPMAIEEFVRFYTPVQALARTVTRDTELGGQHLAAGDKVWMIWASANRDETAFPDPDRVILDRHPNRHLGFGVGIHRCLGMHLARVMFRVALEEILDRMPDYRVSPDADLARFPDASVVYGLLHLPVTFSPGTRRTVGAGAGSALGST